MRLRPENLAWLAEERETGVQYGPDGGQVFEEQAVEQAVQPAATDAPWREWGLR